MKGIAIILTGCLLFLGSEHLRETYQLPGQAVDIACGSDCCDADDDHHSGEEPCDGDHDCLPGCNCSCHFHITAITFMFMELPGSVVQSYHYGHYMNSYTFEYTDNFLQPPRFG